MFLQVHNVIVAALLLTLAAINCRADTILSEDVGNLTWKYTVTNGAARVYGGPMKAAIGWTTGAVVIPDTLGGLPVKAIGSYAFFELGQMTSLKIPESVESIEFYACRGCSNLVTVTLPSNLATLGNAVFSGCKKLEVGSVPDSVTSMGRDTFWGCKSMRSVKFSSQVRDLGTMICYDCDSLTGVSIPDCVTNVGVSAFLNCDNLRSVTLPKGEVTFGNYAFNNCPSLEVVDLPSGFTDFDNAFHNCPSLTTARIRQNISYVDPASFVGCPTLTDILVEDGNAAYKSIGGVLYDATGTELVAWPAALHPVEIPVEVERIGDHAFGWTSDKSGISIPEGVEVAEHAFADPPQEDPVVPEDPVDPPKPEQPREGVYVYRDCFTIIPGLIPHLSCTVPGLEGIDYAVDKYESNNWNVVVHGWGMDDPRIKVAKLGEHYVDDNDMPAGVYEVTGTSQPFVFEFCNWYRNEVLGSHTWYGYVSIALDNDGQIVILESAICNEQGVLTVVGTAQGQGSAFLNPETGCETNCVDDGPDAPVDGLIWRCNFNNGVQWMCITNLTEVASHVLLDGEDIEAIVDNGSYSGRRCAEIEGASGERTWFFVNAKTKDGGRERYVLGKWRSLKTSFRLKSNVGCRPNDEMYGAMTESDGDGDPRFVGIVRVPGSVVNLDDKIALRYCDYELDDYYPTYYWQINAGVTNGLGGIETRTIRLAAKERWSELASPIGNWITVEVETVNDGSPRGLAYRVYINGVLACSEEDGTSVFRARPQAADRTGVTALGIGGLAYVDDVVFSGVATDPLADVYISPNRFGPANEELTAEERDVLAGIIGFESLSGLERITMHPWEDDFGCEPLDAAKTCIDLGISPFHVKPDGGDGKGLTLFFKRPAAVRAVGIDPVSRTVTGQIIPADGTRIVQPPQRFMFGLNRHMDFGTPYSHIEEHGCEMYWYDDVFRLDTSSYATSNGVFTITYDPKFSEEGSAYFSISIKDFRYW